MLKKPSSLVILLLGISSVLLSTHPGYCQDSDLEVYELFDVTLEELLNVGIVSASKKKQSVLDAPATAYVVTEEQIKTRGYVNLVDLLEDIPEIEVQRNSNNEFRNLVTIRGVAGNEKFLVLLNGVRITPATGDSYVLGTQFSIVNAHRVEVIIGPASALYGVDAFSGIINIITQTQEGTAIKGINANGSYGLYNTTDNFFIAGTKFDKVRINLTGHYYFSEEPDYFNLYPQEYVWYTNQFQPKGNVVESPFFHKIRNKEMFHHSAGASFYGDSISREFEIPTNSYYLGAEVSYEDFTAGIVRHNERHSSALGIDPRFTSFDKEAFIEMSHQAIYGKHTYTSFNKKWRLQTSFINSYYEINPNSHFAGSASRWQRGFIYSYGQSSKVEEQFQYDFSRSTTLTAGILYENLSAIPRTALSPVPYDKKEPAALQNLYFIGASGYKLVANGETVEYNDTLAITQDVYHLYYQNYGGFAQIQFKPLKFMEATVGTRFDYNTRFGSSVNPRVGLVARPTKQLHIKVLYGEAFLAPSPEKAYEQSGSISIYNPDKKILEADYFRIPNPNLQPEKLRSLEGSVNLFITSNLSFAANGFYTKIEDLIDLFGKAPQDKKPDNLEATRLEMSVNRGESEIHGGTARLNYLFRIGALTFNNYAAYTYINGDIDNEELLYTAKHTVKSGFELYAGRVSFAPRMIWRSSSNSGLVDGAGGKYFSNDPFYVINLMIRYQAKKTGKLKVNVFTDIRNVTDARYYNVYVGNEEGLPRTPQDPLRVRAGINITLH